MLQGVLSTRTLSLRAASERDRQGQEARDMVRFKMEQLQREEKKKTEREERSKQDCEILFSTVPVDDIDFSEDSSEDNNGDDGQETDSDWEDVEEEVTEDNTSNYNLRSLKYFSMECDRYGVSDRAGAKIGNGLLKDLGIVKRGCTAKLICPSKLRRERRKWGKLLGEEKDAVKLPQGLYTDGKKVPTLVRVTTVTKVQVPGGKGRAAYRTVSSTSNKMVVEDHFPVVAEPSGQYITHVTPVDGTGLALAQELVPVIREKDTVIRVMGMDGCPTNTGIHNGAIRLVEVMLGDVVQHAICGLHLNELVFWHILSETDGVTKGPESLSGPVGSTLHHDIWTEPVVSYSAIPGKVTALPEEVITDLSRDQLLAYRYAIAIQTGMCLFYTKSQLKYTFKHFRCYAR